MAMQLIGTKRVGRPLPLLIVTVLALLSHSCALQPTGIVWQLPALSERYPGLEPVWVVSAWDGARLHRQELPSGSRRWYLETAPAAAIVVVSATPVVRYQGAPDLRLSPAGGWVRAARLGTGVQRGRPRIGATSGGRLAHYRLQFDRGPTARALLECARHGFPPSLVNAERLHRLIDARTEGSYELLDIDRLNRALLSGEMTSHAVARLATTRATLRLRARWDGQWLTSAPETAPLTTLRIGADEVLLELEVPLGGRRDLWRFGPVGHDRMTITADPAGHLTVRTRRFR